MVRSLGPESLYAEKRISRLLCLGGLLQRSRVSRGHEALGRSVVSGVTRKDFLGLIVTAFGMIALAPLAQAQAEQKSEHEPPGAQEKETDPEMSPEQKWQSRFPQPVLVSDLFGRKMLDSRQGVLGNITAVVETEDHAIMIAFARRRWLLFSGETVVVPMFVTALLGPFVMILDLSDDEIETLPVFSPAGTRPIDAHLKIKMALTKN